MTHLRPIRFPTADFRIIRMFFLAMASISHATVAIKNQWLLGGDGALVAKVGSAPLTRTGTTTDGVGVAAGSTVSQSFTNPINGSDGNPAASNYMTAAITLANTSNWGISAWIKPSVPPNGSPQGECGFFKIGTNLAWTAVPEPTTAQAILLDSGLL